MTDTNYLYEYFLERSTDDKKSSKQKDKTRTGKQKADNSKNKEVKKA
jgi:hypothetical protein